MIAAPDKIASIRRLERELSLDEITAQIDQVDIILTEGYTRAGKPAIEVLRAENGLELVSQPPQLIALACNIPLHIAVPQFSLEDAAGIADFIERNLLV